MTLMLLMVVEIGVAMAIGFALGRIWQIRYDLEQQRAVGFTAPPIPHSATLISCSRTDPLKAEPKPS